MNLLVKTNKNLLKGEGFKKHQKKALKLTTKSLDYSNRKDKKYFGELESGKKIHFGNPKYHDYLIHQDKERQDIQTIRKVHSLLSHHFCFLLVFLKKRIKKQTIS